MPAKAACFMLVLGKCEEFTTSLKTRFTLWLCKWAECAKHQLTSLGGQRDEEWWPQPVCEMSDGHADPPSPKQKHSKWSSWKTPRIYSMWRLQSASPFLIVITVCVARWGEVQLEAWIRSFCCVGACRYCRQRVIVSVCGEGSWMHMLYASSHFSAVF